MTRSFDSDYYCVPFWGGREGGLNGWKRRKVNAEVVAGRRLPLSLSPLTWKGISQSELDEEGERREGVGSVIHSLSLPGTGDSMDWLAVERPHCGVCGEGRGREMQFRRESEFENAAPSRAPEGGREGTKFVMW